MLHKILNWCETFIRERKELVIFEVCLVALMLPLAVCITPHRVLDDCVFHRCGHRGNVAGYRQDLQPVGSIRKESMRYGSLPEERPVQNRNH